MCHRRTNKESVLSADVGPPETHIINISKCNMSIYIIIGDHIIKIEIYLRIDFFCLLIKHEAGIAYSHTGTYMLQ